MPSATQSGFFMPNYWLAEEPPGRLAFEPIPVGESRRVVWRRRLSCGIEVTAHLGGLVLFDFSSIAHAMSNSNTDAFGSLVDSTLVRVRIINAWAPCLQTVHARLGESLMPLFHVEHRDLVHTNDLARSLGGPGLSLGGYVAGGFVFAEGGLKYGVISAAALDESAALLDRVLLASDTRALELLALIARAAAEMDGHDYAIAVVTAWTACEVMLASLATRYLAEPQPDEAPRMSKERRRQILAGRDFTAAVMTELLALGGWLDATTYEGLTAARKARNNWVHDMKPVAIEAASAGLTTATRMFVRAFGIQVAARPTPSIAC